MSLGHTQVLWPCNIWHIFNLLVWIRDFWPTLPSNSDATLCSGAPMTPIWGQRLHRGNKLLEGVVSQMSKWGLVQFGPTQCWMWHIPYFFSNPPRFWVLGFATSVYFHPQFGGDCRSFLKAPYVHWSNYWLHKLQPLSDRQHGLIDLGRPGILSILTLI